MLGLEFMTDEELHKGVDGQRKAFGAEPCKKAGLDIFEKEDPDIAKLFILETEYHMRPDGLPEMWRELIWFASCVACNNRNGAKIHAAAALKAGATKRMVLDTIHSAAICQTLGLLNVAYDITPSIDAAKK
jgi:alkylhydroperoxidase/carboxymuconolactone decarboxylase family protein YurZ